MRLAASVGEALANLRRSPGPTLLAVGTITASLFLLGGYALGLQNLTQLVRGVRGQVVIAAYLEDEFRTLRNVGIGLTFGVGLSAAIAALVISAAACPTEKDAEGNVTIDGSSTCAQATGWTLIPVSLGATAAGIALWVVFERRANRAEALKLPVEAPPRAADTAGLDFRLTPVLDARGVPGGLGLVVRF